MDLRIVSNHVLVDVHTDLGVKTCVVDTGSPLTFFYDAVKEYYLNEAVHTPRPAPPIASGVNDAQLVGERIDGFIGSHSIATSSHFNNDLASTLLLSYRHNTVSIR